MALSRQLKDEIIETIIQVIREKFRRYKPETHRMPFQYRLLGKDRMALFSFIHSLNTVFGTSIFEPLAERIAKSNFPEVQRQFKVGDKLSEAAQYEIQHIINSLSTGALPNKPEEIKRLRKVCRLEPFTQLSSTKVDLYIRADNGSVHLFDIKTAKPNVSNFKDYKRTLLEWVAICLYQNPKLEIDTYIAIPYNPYEPKPYERWTIKGMLDLQHELKVAEEFWDFLGGEGAYQDLLGCFESAGLTLKPEIEAYFTQFQ